MLIFLKEEDIGGTSRRYTYKKLQKSTIYFTTQTMLINYVSLPKGAYMLFFALTKVQLI